MISCYRVSGLAFLSLVLAGCAPISAEKVAATARPAAATATAEHFWTSETREGFESLVAKIEEGCSGAASALECGTGKLAAAWPSAAEYVPYCQAPTSLVERAKCLAEYDFWAQMGRKHYPSYRIREGWASYDLPKNPTWAEWYTRRLMECDPHLNKAQEVSEQCIADTAKREFGIAPDAIKGCYYTNPALKVFCYWMAAFDDYVEAKGKALEAPL